MTMQDLTGLTTTQRAALETLQALDESERLAARDTARELVKRKVGAKPDRVQFENATVSQYPAWVTKTIGGMLAIAFIGAFFTSAFSVFSAGRNHYLETMQGGAGVFWQAVIVGVSVVLLAEFLTIASVLGARIMFHGKRAWQAVMLIPIAGGVVIAVTANAVIAQPVGFWPWLVTAGPPLSVVFLSLILEQIALSDIKRRHANERAYQAALSEWRAATAEPEQHAEWRITFGNALKEAIREKNASGRGKTEREQLMQTLTGQEWSALVWREYQADQWLQEMPANPFGHSQPGQLPAIHQVQTIKAPAPQLVSANGNGNGKH